MVSAFHYTDIMSCDEIQNTLLDVDALDVDIARKIIKKLLDQNTKEHDIEKEVKDIEAKVEELERDSTDTEEELARAELRISELEELVSKLQRGY